MKNLRNRFVEFCRDRYINYFLWLDCVVTFKKGDFFYREGGPTFILSGGSKHWALNRELHRLDGPAMIQEDGSESWYVNGKLHRLDGPAQIMMLERRIIFENWYINGTCVSEDVGIWTEEYSIDSNWREWTDEDKILFKLRFG